MSPEEIMDEIVLTQDDPGAVGDLIEIIAEQAIQIACANLPDTQRIRKLKENATKHLELELEQLGIINQIQELVCQSIKTQLSHLKYFNKKKVKK